MSLIIAGALLLATTVADGVENPRFVSPGGEMCVVTRRFPQIADFDRIGNDEYLRRLEADGAFVEPLPGDSPPGPQPARGALYRIWPSGWRELLAEFTFGSNEQPERVLVADDGHFVTHGPVRCEAGAALLTIRGPDGAVVRALRVRDVMTAHDQQWLCRGNASDVRIALGETLRVTMLVTDGGWDDPDARHREVDIDLRSGAVAAPDGNPDDNHCPAALLVTPAADDALPRVRSDADVVVLGSQTLLDRAVVRVLPEYPLVATKARISGRVGVHVVVGTDGKVESVSIVKPLPFGLDEAVRNAVVKWEFEPAPTRVSGVLAFVFEIVRNWRLETRSHGGLRRPGRGPGPADRPGLRDTRAQVRTPCRGLACRRGPGPVAPAAGGPPGPAFTSTSPRKTS